MKLVKTDPRKIKVPETRVTSQMDEETRAQFAASVKEWGIESPILCFEVDGVLTLVDGLHRLQEALDQGAPIVEVVVREGSMVEVLTRNIMLDHLRGKHRVVDMIRVLSSLYTDHGLDPDQIGEKTGLKRDYIEKLIKISRAAPAVLEAIDQGALGIGHAEQVVRLPQAIQQEELVEKYKVYRWTVQETREFVDRVLEEMLAIQSQPAAEHPLVPSQPRVYLCEGCKRETEPRYLRPVMVCPDCFGHVWRLAKSHTNEEGTAEQE